jgi:hypothetical protein
LDDACVSAAQRAYLDIDGRVEQQCNRELPYAVRRLDACFAHQNATLSGPFWW